MNAPVGSCRVLTVTVPVVRFVTLPVAATRLTALSVPVEVREATDRLLTVPVVAVRLTPVN